MKSRVLSNKIAKREQKWHRELNTLFSISFWEKARKLCASICHENPIKWLQYQIVRNSLQTNLIVSHFIENVNQECHFCQLYAESISHLFWLCSIVGSFLEGVFVFITNSGIDFKPSKTQFLFGFLEEPFTTPRNYLVLFLKKFIWNCKFKPDRNLSVAGFKNFLFYLLSDLKDILHEKNKPAKFDEWNDLYLLLDTAASQDQHDLLQQAPLQQAPQVLPVLPQAVHP